MTTPQLLMLSIDAISISNPTNLVLAFSIDVTPYGKQANSIDVAEGVVVAAVVEQLRSLKLTRIKRFSNRLW